jgi:hypothetical protein
MKNQKPFFAPPPFLKSSYENHFLGEMVFKTSPTHTQISIFAKSDFYLIKVTNFILLRTILNNFNFIRK